MKHVLICLISLFVFASGILYGQYIPIVAEGKFWIYLNHQDEDHPSPVSGHAITIEGDSIINAFRYKKVYLLGLAGEHHCPYPPCFQFIYPYQTTSKSLISFIREDTVSKKVFMLPAFDANLFCDTKEYLIFDYALNVGDTLNSCIYQFIGAASGDNTLWGIVDSINVSYKFGKNRKTIFTTGVMKYGGLPPIGEVLILEGIGLEHYGLIHQPISYLVDFCVGSMKACGILSAQSTLETQKEVTIFPNPTNGIVQIAVGNEDLKIIRIHTLQGILVNEIHRSNTLDINNLEPGIYLLEVILENGGRFPKLVVKEN